MKLSLTIAPSRLMPSAPAFADKRLNFVSCHSDEFSKNSARKFRGFDMAQDAIHYFVMPAGCSSYFLTTTGQSVELRSLWPEILAFPDFCYSRIS